MGERVIVVLLPPPVLVDCNVRDAVGCTGLVDATVFAFGMLAACVTGVEATVLAFGALAACVAGVPPV